MSIALGTPPAGPDFAPIDSRPEVSATVPSVPAPLDPVAEAIQAEERFARKAARYGLRAAVWAMVVVGLYCASTPVGVYREPGELLFVMLSAIGGSVGLDWLVRVVTREPRD